MKSAETQKAHDEFVGRLEGCLKTGGGHQGEIFIMLTSFHLSQSVLSFVV